VNRLPRWRIAAAVLILGILAALLAVCGPYYFHNLKLQNYVSDLTRIQAQSQHSDAEIRSLILEKARTLDLPVTEDNVRIARQPGGVATRIDVRYEVPIDVPGYTVKLHFYPGAGSR
jgi:hypothetical protein